MGEELAHNATLFLQNELAERWGIITCTRTELSPDMHNAKLWISLFPTPSDDEQALKALVSVKYELADYLRRRVPMKFIPHYSFAIDHGGEDNERINKLMENI